MNRLTLVSRDTSSCLAPARSCVLVAMPRRISSTIRSRLGTSTVLFLRPYRSLRLRLTRTPPYRCGRPFEMERGHVQLSALFRSVAAFLPDGRHESVVGWGFNFAGATRLFGCRPP